MSIASINPIDVLVISVIILCLSFGILRGMVQTVFSIASYFLAFYGSNKLAPIVTPIINHRIADITASKIISYILLFLAIFLLMRWLNIAATKFLKFVGLTYFDKLLGGITGAIKGIIISTIIIIGLEMLPHFKQYMDSSKAIEYLKPLRDEMRRSVPRYINTIKRGY